MDVEAYFQTRLSQDKSRQVLWPIICNYLQKFIWKDKKILELACWYGDFINNISAKEKYATDIWEWSKKFLNKEVNFKVWDLSKIWREQPYEDNHFDCIFMSNFLEHLDDEQIQNLMDWIKKIINKNWKIMIIQPNFHYMYKDYFDDYTHKKIFTHVSLCDYIESNWFQMIHCEKKFLPWSFKKNKLPLRLSKLWLKIYFKQNFIRFGGQMFLVFENKNEGNK